MEFICQLAQGIVWMIAALSFMVVIPTAILCTVYVYKTRKGKEVVSVWEDDKYSRECEASYEADMNPDYDYEPLNSTWL